MKIRTVDALNHQSPSLLRKVVDMAQPGSINLGLGQPVIPVPAVLRQAAAASTEQLAAYSTNLGFAHARAAIAQAANRTAPEVMLTIGAQHALTLAMLGLLQPGDEVLIPDPAFPVYDMTARWIGATPIHYALRAESGFQPDPAEIVRLITPRTRLMVINTPCNPTGVCWREDVLQEILACLTRHGVPYLSDEVYSTLAFDPVSGAPTPTPPPLPSVLSPEGGLVANSLSKSHALMGWRLGWLIAPPDILQKLIPLQQITIACAATPSQEAAAAAFSPEGFVAAAAIAQEMSRRRLLALSLLQKHLPDLPPTPSDGALYLFLDTSAYEPDDLKLCLHLLNHLVTTIPGSAFGSHGRSRLRLAFGVPTEDLHEGIQRIAKGLHAL